MDKLFFHNSFLPMALAVSTAAGASSTASALLGSFGSESMRLAVSMAVAVLAGIFGFRHGRAMEKEAPGERLNVHGHAVVRAPGLRPHVRNHRHDAGPPYAAGPRPCLQEPLRINAGGTVLPADLGSRPRAESLARAWNNSPIASSTSSLTEI